MALLVPDAGEVKLLEMALKDAAVADQMLRLFVNDKTPVEADTVVSYTEMSTQGYAAQSLTRAGWTVSTSGGVSTAQNAQKTFTFNGTGGDTTVYGYFITMNDGANKVLWAERFANPVTIRNNGDQIKITPKIELE